MATGLIACRQGKGGARCAEITRRIRLEQLWDEGDLAEVDYCAARTVVRIDGCCRFRDHATGQSRLSVHVSKAGNARQTVIEQPNNPTDAVSEFHADDDRASTVYG